MTEGRSAGDLEQQIGYKRQRRKTGTPASFEIYQKLIFHIFHFFSSSFIGAVNFL